MKEFQESKIKMFQIFSQNYNHFNQQMLTLPKHTNILLYRIQMIFTVEIGKTIKETDTGRIIIKMTLIMKDTGSTTNNQAQVE